MVITILINGLETHNEKSTRDKQVRWVPSRVNPHIRIPVRSTAAKRTASQRGLTRIVFESQTSRADRLRWAAGCAAKLVRIAPRALIDLSESGPSALAAIRDGVADALGVDDRDMDQGGVIRWSYAQEKGPYGVRVEIQATERAQAPMPDHLRVSVTRSGRIRGVFG